MTPAERESLLVRILDALSDRRSAMAEGRPHQKLMAELFGSADLIDRLQGMPSRPRLRPSRP
ncbi:hypothetical protein ACMHYB_24945 [Sorangium sp. So ce1128]